MLVALTAWLVLTGVLGTVLVLMCAAQGLRSRWRARRTSAVAAPVIPVCLPVQPTAASRSAAERIPA